MHPFEPTATAYEKTEKPFSGEENILFSLLRSFIMKRLVMFTAKRYDRTFNNDRCTYEAI